MEHISSAKIQGAANNTEKIRRLTQLGHGNRKNGGGPSVSAIAARPIHIQAIGFA